MAVAACVVLLLPAQVVAGVRGVWHWRAAASCVALCAWSVPSGFPGLSSAGRRPSRQEEDGRELATKVRAAGHALGPAPSIISSGGTSTTSSGTRKVKYLCPT